MSVNVRVQDKDTSNVKTFSVQEDATPIDPSSSAGGVGQITVGMDDYPDAPRLIGGVILTDGSRGKTSGNIKSVNASDGALTITADSVLGMFNTNRTVPPYTGTLGGAIQFYCDLVGITNDVVTDASIASRSVVYPGWTGNVWVAIKQMLAKEQIEMALVFDRISVRSLRKLTVNEDRKTTEGRSIDNNGAAQKVEVYYYNNVSGVQQEIFPVKGEVPAPYVVNAGETIVITQQVNASMTSVNQPVVQDFVANTTFAGTNGVYAVSGNDGLPVTAAQWTAQGGSVKVAITDDPSIIEITIKGATATNLAPYRIGMTSGSSNYYNSLHITGTGVTWDKKMVTLRTGVPADQTSVEVGVTVDNPFISTLADAYSGGAWVSGSYAGLNYSVSGSAFNVNRAGEGRDLIQATIGDFNMVYPGGTLISEFNTIWSGQNIADFNEFWLGQVDLLWENQLFGNVTGARVFNDDANFRVTSATTTESSVQYTATLDTIVEDFNNEWPENGTTTVMTNWFNNPNFATGGGSTRTIRTNAVLNPGFEVGTTGMQTVGTTTNTRDTTEFHSGVASLRCVTTAVTSGMNVAVASMAANPTYVVPVVAQAWVKGPAGNTVSIGAQEYTPPSTPIGTTGSTPFVLTGGWDFVWVTRPNIGIGNVARPIVTMNVPGTFYVDDLQVIYGATTPVDSFNGTTSAAGDFTYAWSGTAHNSTSLQRAANGVAGISNYFTPQIWQSLERETGARSVAFIKQTSQVGTGIVLPTSPAIAPSDGEWVTAFARVKSAPGAGMRFSIRSSAGGGYGQQVVVADGTWQTMVTMFQSTTAIPLIGAQLFTVTQGIPMYVDRAAIFVGPETYPGLFFAGDTPDTHTQGVTTDYAWVGTADASFSTKTSTTNDYLISDFNAQFEGMTMKDFNVIPLRKDY